MPHLTPEAKAKLSTTIRRLRDRLLTTFQTELASTYRLALPVAKANLPEALRERRQRLEAWLDEQVRAESGRRLKKSEQEAARQRHLLAAVKLAAATLLNRLVVLRQLEARGQRKPAVVTGGWRSPGYQEFREFAPALCQDETEGYGFLLQLIYDELALELPGVFGPVGLTKLMPIPAIALRETSKGDNRWKD